MFLPATLAQPGFVGLALAVALTVFVLLEYVRLAKLPPLGEDMHQFMKVRTGERRRKRGRDDVRKAC